MTVSAAKAGSFGNPDEPPEGATNAKGPGNFADPGPQNPALGNQFPSAQSAPATDVGGTPTRRFPPNQATDAKSARERPAHGPKFLRKQLPRQCMDADPTLPLKTR